MPDLPSFIELMASLGLDSDIKPSVSTSRSRSGSCSSVSSFGSSHRDHSPISSTLNLPSDVLPRDLDADRRHSLTRSRVSRYTPYTPAVSSLANKRNSTSFEGHCEDLESQSSTPPLSSSPPRRRPSPLRSLENRREEPFNTPISSYLRRKTPQNSPTVATFTHRDPVERPETIALPSLISLQ